MWSIPQLPEPRLEEVVQRISHGISEMGHCNVLCEQVAIICKDTLADADKLSRICVFAQSHGWTAELLYGLEMVRFKAKVWKLFDSRVCSRF